MQRKKIIKFRPNKRLRNLIFLIICSVSIYLIIYFIPKNYNFEYKINGYKVTEKYIKKDKMYKFIVEKKDKKYEFISDKKYTPSRKLLKKITEYNNDSTSCILLDSKLLNTEIYCLKNGEMIDYHLTNVIPKKYIKNKELKKLKYKDIELNLVDDKTYFVWNYTGFYKINKNNKEKINIFEKDIYNLNLSIVLDKYLIIADYDQEYNFNKFKIVNLKNNKIDEFEFDYEISFDSRIIGTYKNKFYLIDNKNKREYEINFKKKKIDVISKNGYGKIIKNNKFEKIKLNKIITDELEFDKNNYYSWNIKNNNLYLKQKSIKNDIKVSTKNIKTIVYSTNHECYYIAEDKLYKYNFEYGEEKVLEYFELNFNYENMIYIYE